MSDLKIAKLTKQTFGATIALQLREAILTGDIAPGSPIVETDLAHRFGVSRGPLREAIRQLADEGLLVHIPFTGTHVMELSVDDVREIHSMRTVLETFAFELIWERRDDTFRNELRRRQTALDEAIARGDEAGSIRCELDLHSLVFETSQHRLLMESWNSLRGRLQLYWSSHHLAHDRHGPKSDAHDSYIAAAFGESLDALRREIADHMQRGADLTEDFILERNRMTQNRKHEAR